MLNDFHKTMSAGTRPFPAPIKTKLELNLKLLPQSLTKTDVCSQLLSCGAVRKRPLTARDRYPVGSLTSGCSTPRQHVTPERPQTARERTGTDLYSSISGGSTSQTRRALEVMRLALKQQRKPRLSGADGTGQIQNLDIQGEKAMMTERQKTYTRGRGEDKENEPTSPARATFHDEKDSGGDGWATPRSPRPTDRDEGSPRKRMYRGKSDGGGIRSLPHTASAQLSLPTAEKDANEQPSAGRAKLESSRTIKESEKKIDESEQIKRQKAKEKWDFLNAIDPNILLFAPHAQVQILNSAS